MPDVNQPACPTHGVLPRALHEHSFRGIVEVVQELIATISGVGTISYSHCPQGYPWNFEGVVRVLEDLNVSISGIAPGVIGGSGIYITESGGVSVVNADYGVITSGGLGAGTNVTFTYEPGKTVINTAAVLSGGVVAVNVQNTAPIGVEGTLWYDTNQGRLFVYASGDWYQTNADAFALKGAYPPSGIANTAQRQDGTLWYNTQMGSLFIYDAVTSGWYETAPGDKGASYSTGAPIPEKEGELWYSEGESVLKVWNGTQWVSV
jgi:hypothetical protein